jgi:AraC-like DNA-binding protein
MVRDPDWIVEPRHGQWTVEILGGRRYRYGENWGSGGKQICDDFSRLYMVMDGAGVVEGVTKNVALIPGHIYLFTPTWRGIYRTSDSIDLCWLHVRLLMAPGLDALKRSGLPVELPLSDQDREVFLSLISCISTPRPYDAMRLVSGVSALLAPFLPESWDGLLPGARTPAQVQAVLDHMEKHLSEPLSLNHLAKVAKCHPTYLSNRFSSLIGIPPMRHLQHLRLERARSQILSSDFSVAEIAKACGFQDPMHFSKAFHRRYGLPPSRLRGMSKNMDV